MAQKRGAQVTWHTHIRSKTAKILAGGIILGLGMMSFLSFLGEAGANRLAALSPSDLQNSELSPLKSGQPVSYYTAAADAALAMSPPDFALAEQASIEVLQRTPGDATTWNRLAFIDLRRDGQLARDGVAALYKSYEASPFGDLAVMIWRVEFASSVWSSLPDDLRSKTLAQIPMIGRFGNSWDWRTRTCRENPHQEIYAAACAIAPGVVRPGAG